MDCGLRFFESLGEVDYTTALQLDGAFSVTHINSGMAPVFNRTDARNLAVVSRKSSLSMKDEIEDVIERLKSFDGTEQNYSKEDRIQLWRAYWEEYINAFDNLVQILPKSVVTLYVGRHAVELGLKYMLINTNTSIPNHHRLEDLAKLVFDVNRIEEDYMNDIVFFCESYAKYIEGENVEFFRFPEYKNGYFAGNRLDIKWLSYNFALIILKLMHFTGLDECAD